jgi:hypothetical protein
MKIKGYAHSTHELYPTYLCWKGMRDRCKYVNRPDYKHYGGKGISVCERWLFPISGFVNFLKDMGERPSNNHTLDRIDGNKNYEPDNCRWATRKEQALNRPSKNLFKESDKTISGTDISLKLGGYKNLVYGRLSAGWPYELATTIPYTFNESLDKILKKL